MTMQDELARGRCSRLDRKTKSGRRATSFTFPRFLFFTDEIGSVVHACCSLSVNMSCNQFTRFISGRIERRGCREDAQTYILTMLFAAASSL